MGHDSPDQFAFGGVEACLEDDSDAASVQRRTRDACNLGIRGNLHSIVELILVVVVIDLKDLSAAEQHIGLVMSLMELLVEIRGSDRLLDLRYGLTSQNGLIDHTSSTKKQDITRDILVRMIHLFFVIGCHEFAWHLA